MSQQVALQLQWVQDADARCKELRAEVHKLARLLDSPKPELRSWHDKVRAQLDRVNELYPTGLTLR